MRGTFVATWLTFISLAWAAPMRGQDAKPDKEPKKISDAKPDAKADAKVDAKKEDKKDAKLEELRVTLDYSEVPQHKEWAEKAKKLVETWHPKIEEILKSDGYTAPRDVKIVFKNQKTIAFANPKAKTISISSEWITKNPNDFGMVAHELTHIIQSYRDTPRNAGWIVEGIADYVRHYAYEPDAKMRPIKATAKYTDQYQTAAQFLRWIEKTHDKEIVVKLNRALRQREYQVGIFQRETGKTVDELWDEFFETLKKK